MTRDWRLVAAIVCGGFAGAILRAEVTTWLPYDPTQWPWPTFLVNIAGAAALGYFATRLQERLAITTYRRPLLATGFCGGLTTFSTMQVELVRMLDGGAAGLAVAYLLASCGAGMLALLLTSQLVRRGTLSA